MIFHEIPPREFFLENIMKEILRSFLFVRIWKNIKLVF